MVTTLRKARGKGIGKNSFRLTLEVNILVKVLLIIIYELAKEKGFKIAFAECTGKISTKIAIEHSKMSNEYHQTRLKM